MITFSHFSPDQRQRINALIKQNIDFITWCYRTSIVGNSLNEPSSRFEKGRINDRSLAHVSNGIITYVDGVGYDFTVDISSLQLTDTTLPSTLYASGKGLNKPVYQQRTGKTQKILLKNSQTSEDTPTTVQLDNLKQLIDIGLVYGTGDHKSIDIFYAEDLQHSHIDSNSTARLEVQLPQDICARLYEDTYVLVDEINIRSIIDTAVDQTLTTLCKQLATKAQNENSSTPSSVLHRTVGQPLSSMDLAELESLAPISEAKDSKLRLMM